MGDSNFPEKNWSDLCTYFIYISLSALFLDTCPSSYLVLHIATSTQHRSSYLHIRILDTGKHLYRPSLLCTPSIAKLANYIRNNNNNKY